MAEIPLTEPHGKLEHTLTESISNDTHVPIDTVQRIYEEELSTLASSARVTQFLGVLARHRVRDRLRDHQKGSAEPAHK